MSQGARHHTTAEQGSEISVISIALLANNFDVKWVMAQVGHADSRMTMNVYAQLEQRVKREHGEGFDRLVRQRHWDPKIVPQRVDF